MCTPVLQPPILCMHQNLLLACMPAWPGIRTCLRARHLLRLQLCTQLLGQVRHYCQLGLAPDHLGTQVVMDVLMQHLLQARRQAFVVQLQINARTNCSKVPFFLVEKHMGI